MIRLVIADDHTLFREGLKALLKDEGTIETVAECRNTDELFLILSSEEINVVLVGFALSEKGAYESLQLITEKFHSVKILILSAFYNEEDIGNVFKLGALGYIHQNSEIDELIYAIHTVSKGNKFISPYISLNLLERIESPIQKGQLKVLEKKAPLNRPPIDISNSELEVLTLIAQGYTNAQIADKLFTSKRTIESHRKNLIDKTNTKNTASLIRFAFANGIIE